VLYRFVEEQPEDWDVAEISCIKMGGWLVTLNNKQEKDFVAKRLVNKKGTKLCN